MAVEPIITFDSALTVAVLLLLIHFVGDFLFQSTDMAINKATSLKWLSIHISAYTFTLFIGAIVLFGIDVAIIYALINGGIHFVTDFFTSKMNASLYAREDKKWYYTGIGFDQFIHGASLLLTYDYLVYSS